MNNRSIHLLVMALALPAVTSAAKGPVGWQVYRELDRIGEATSGVVTRQFSSYDRKGGNDDGFEGTYSCIRDTTETGCIIAEATGAGEIQSIWFTRDGGDVTKNGNIRITLDGVEVLNAPLQKVVDGELGAPFVFPLVANAFKSSGGVYIKVPMPYRERMEVAVDNNPHFYHVTYRSFSDAEGVATFDPSDEALDVVKIWKNAGTLDPKPRQSGANTVSGSFRTGAGTTTTLAQRSGPGMISALRIRIPQIEGPTSVSLVSDDGRAFGKGGSSQFVARIDPANAGVRIVRRSDPTVTEQRAHVVLDGVTTVGEWLPAPAASAPRWLEQTVEIAPERTTGKSELSISNRFISSSHDFNEFTYRVYSRVGDRWALTDTVDLGRESADSESAHKYMITGETWSDTREYPTTGDADVIRISDEILRDVRLRMTFDGGRTVDSPLGEFFGSGLGEYEVRSLFLAMDTAPDGWYSAWWPMPYGKTAKIELLNGSGHDITAGEIEVTAVNSDRWASAPRFSTASHSGQTVRDQDWMYLETDGQGKFFGVTHTMYGGNNRGYLEGDERVYVDGATEPQIHGTGTEDFYHGGWYFNRGTFTLPTNGNTAHEPGTFGSTGESTCCYRLMIGDAVPFSTSIRFGVEHGPANHENVLYSSTAYWYSSLPQSGESPGSSGSKR